MKQLKIAAALAALSVTATLANAQLIGVSQHGSLQGAINPFTTNISFEDLYDYNNIESYFWLFGWHPNYDQSYNGDNHGLPYPPDNGVISFFVEDVNGSLAFFNVFGPSIGDERVGLLRGSLADVALITDTPTSILVRDDPGLPDIYLSGPGGHFARTFWATLEGDTDGYVIGDFSGSNWSLTMNFLNIEGNLAEYGTWEILNNDGNNAWTSIPVDLVVGAGVQFAPVPEPATIGLAAVGGLVAIGVIRRRRKKN
jgi:hypothetical protein